MSHRNQESFYDYRIEKEVQDKKLIEIRRRKVAIKLTYSFQSTIILYGTLFKVRVEGLSPTYY
jgi:hypothetical protein